MKIDGIDYTVKAVVAISKSGERYYDHKLTQIEKGNLIENLSASTAEEYKKTTLSDYKDKTLFSILQINLTLP